MKKLLFCLAIVPCIGASYAQVTWNTFTTQYGNIQLGPASSAQAHIYTDRPKFLFNKDIYIIGGNLSSTSTLNLQTNGINRMTLLYSNGNVGIGTITPASKLHVSGDGKFEGALRVDYNTTTDYSYGLSVWVNRDLTKAFSVSKTTGEELFVVWGNGVVNAKKIYAEAIEILPNSLGISWPDYVFKNDYKLRNLYELETFIQSNHHLPEIPSESEVKQNGVDLLEMNAALLKKVEELTLYVIDLQKQIDSIKCEPGQ